jgi:hypothetical protein
LQPRIIFASPPCNSFSTESMGTCGSTARPPALKRERPRLRRAPDRHRRHAPDAADLRIIAMLRSNNWVNESPRGRLPSFDLLAASRDGRSGSRVELDRAKPSDL